MEPNELVSTVTVRFLIRSGMDENRRKALRYKTPEKTEIEIKNLKSLYLIPQTTLYLNPGLSQRVKRNP